MRSHNAFAQILNTGIANAGINGADMAPSGTGSDDSMEVVPDKAEPDEKVLPKLSSSPARYNGASVGKNWGVIRSH
jgi:hypothetical protein